MTNTTMTSARKSKGPAPVRRKGDTAPETTADGSLTPKGYRALDEAARTRKLTNKELDAWFMYEIEAAHDLLGSDTVRGVRTDPAWDSCPTVYRLEDVHAAWRSATENHLSNVATVRDAWNDASDEDCCLSCLCDRFLEQTLEYITIDHRAGLIVLQGC